LDNCLFGDTDLSDRIRRANDGTVRLMQYEADALKSALCYARPKVDDAEQLDVWRRLVDKIVLDTPPKILPHNLPSVMPKSHAHLTESLPDGLTPEQVVQFHDYSWGDPECPLQFNHGLSVEEVSTSVFFRNAQLLLNTLIELEGQATATARKNLNRKVVKRMFNEMEMDNKEREFITAFPKTLNEKDVYPLHCVKRVCECAGLIEYRRQKLSVPKNHYPLLSDGKAGELYYLLFHAYFNKFHSKASYGSLDYSLYKLGMLCDEYQPVEDLFHQALPSYLASQNEEALREFKPESFLTSWVIEPLVEFGLLKCTYEENMWPKVIQKVRKTALFDRFIRVNLPPPFARP